MCPDYTRAVPPLRQVSTAVTHVLRSDPLLLRGGCLGRLRGRSRRRAILALKEALHSVHGCHAVFLWVLQHSSLRMAHSVTVDSISDTLEPGLCCIY